MQPPPIPKQKRSTLGSFIRWALSIVFGGIVLLVATFLIYNQSLISKARLATQGVHFTQEWEGGGGGFLGGIVLIKFKYDKGDVHLEGPAVEGDTIYFDTVEKDADDSLIAIIKAVEGVDPKHTYNLRIKILSPPKNGLAFWILNKEYYGVEYPPQGMHQVIYDPSTPQKDEVLPKEHQIELVMPNGLHKVL